MKPRIFRDNLWPVFLVIEIMILLLESLVIFCAVYLIILAINHPSQDYDVQDYAVLIIFELFLVGGGSFACGIQGFSHTILERAFGRLLIYNDRIVLKCPFRITKTMMIDSNIYVGVEDYNNSNHAIPIIRGDETSFIYFSTKPYPQEYHEKIHKLRNKKDFFKFYYSDEIALELLKVIPLNKSYLLNGFYQKMQASDRIIKKEKRKRKSKRKK